MDLITKTFTIKNSDIEELEKELKKKNLYLSIYKTENGFSTVTVFGKF